MARGIREAIAFFYRWGEHLEFTHDVLDFFGLKKMIISAVIVFGATVEAWRERITVSPLYLSICVLGVLVLILLFLNLVVGLNRLRPGATTISRQKLGDNLPFVAPEDGRVRDETYKNFGRIMGRVAVVVALLFVVFLYRWYSNPQGNPLNSPLESTVFIDCKRSKLPDVFPSSGEVNTVAFGDPHASARHVGPARVTGIAGAKITWLPEQQQEAHLCRIINQGNDPLFHLEMNFDVSTLLAMEKKGQPKQGTFSGPSIDSFPWTVHLDQIGSRSQSNSYDLHMWNDGPNVVQVNLPTTAKAQIAGQSEWQTFKVEPPTLGGFSIGPNPKVKQ